MNYTEESTEYLRIIDDVKNWENWSNSTIKEFHKCNKNISTTDTRIFRANDKDNNVDNSWYLAKAWIADKKEVYDEEAEEVGELINLSMFFINFCPFCGKELKKDKIT